MAMAASRPHYAVLQQFISEMAIHIRHHGPNQMHPWITVDYIYQHLDMVKAPTKFVFHHIKPTYKHNNRKSKPTINQFEDANEANTPTFSSDSDTSFSSTSDQQSIPEETYFVDENEQSVTLIKFDPSISVFRRRPNFSRLICDACGINGHPASTCYRRGTLFLDRDTQR